VKKYEMREDKKWENIGKRRVKHMQMEQKLRQNGGVRSKTMSYHRM
jgi:hypothetical protein